VIIQIVIINERRDQCVKIGKAHRAGHFSGQSVDEIHGLSQNSAQMLGRF
jgi:hypothetical protein